MNKFILILMAMSALNTYAATELLPCNSEMSDLECKIYEQTNETRVSKGLGQLSISPECMAAATYHAESMQESGVYAHEIKGYKTFPQRMNSFKVPGMKMAENIHHRALAYFSSNDEAAKEIVGDWYDSKGHRKNMMNRSFKSMGVSVVGDYQVQCFSDYAKTPAKSEETRSETGGGLGGFFGKLSIRGVFSRD